MFTQTPTALLSERANSPLSSTQADVSADQTEQASDDLSLDPFLHIELGSAASRLAGLIDAGRERARTAKGAASLLSMIGCLIANAVRAHACGPEMLIHYSRSSNGYVSCRFPRPDWLTHTLVTTTVDGLAASGHLVSYVAPQGTIRANGRQSTFRGTHLLWTLLADIGVGMADLTTSAPEIILRNQDKVALSLDLHTPSLAAEVAHLKALNKHLKRQKLSLDLPNGVSPNEPVDFTQNHVRRIYSRSSFDLNGRFYGPWWQNVRSDLRCYIRIGGQKTVELDYKACSPSLMYHLEGLEPPEDAYAVPELKALYDQQGAWSEGRSTVKAIFARMVNAEHRGGTHNSDAFRGLPNSVTPKQAMDWIEQHHEPIQHYFHSGSGLRLMRLESDICLSILIDSVLNNIAMLPVHDAFVVADTDADYAKKIMEFYYELYVGFRPRITSS